MMEFLPKKDGLCTKNDAYLHQDMGGFCVIPVRWVAQEFLPTAALDSNRECPNPNPSPGDRCGGCAVLFRGGGEPRGLPVGERAAAARGVVLVCAPSGQGLLLAGEAVSENGVQGFAFKS